MPSFEVPPRRCPDGNWGTPFLSGIAWKLRWFRREPLIGLRLLGPLVRTRHSQRVPCLVSFLRFIMIHQLRRLILGSRLGPVPAARRCSVRRCRPRLEVLESRLAPATLAIDAAGNAVFTGVAGNDSVTLSRDLETTTYRIQFVGDTVAVSGAGAGGWSTGAATVTGPDSTISSWTFNLGGGVNSLTVGANDSFNNQIIGSFTTV